MAAGEDWSAPCTDEACRAARAEALAPLRARGSASNVLVIVGAVTGGALLVAGATLLGLGRKRAREARLLEPRACSVSTPKNLMRAVRPCPLSGRRCAARSASILTTNLNYHD